MADARSQARHYGTIDYDVQMREQEQRAQEQSNFYSPLRIPEHVKLLRLPEDRQSINIDILPFVTDHFGEPKVLPDLTYYRHTNIGKRNYICPKKTLGKPCPICDAMNKYDFNDQEERRIRDALKPRARGLYLVRWLDAPGTGRDDLYLLDQSQFLFGDKIKNRLRTRDRNDPVESAWSRFPDLIEGFMLRVGLTTEQFRGSNYVKPTNIDFKARTYQYAKTPEEADKILSEMPDLYKCLNVLSYEELEEAYRAQSQGFEVEMNTSPTNQDAQKKLDPTQGHNPIVLHDVSVYTSQPEVEGDLPF